MKPKKIRLIKIILILLIIGFQIGHLAYIQLSLALRIPSQVSSCLNIRPIYLSLQTSSKNTQVIYSNTGKIAIAIPSEATIISIKTAGRHKNFTLNNELRVILGEGDNSNIKKTDMKKSLKEIANIYRLSSFVEYDLLDKLMNTTASDIQLWKLPWDNWQTYKYLMVKKASLYCDSETKIYFFKNNSIEGYILAQNSTSHYIAYIKKLNSELVEEIVYSGKEADLNTFSSLINSVKFSN